jgi:endonuclease-3
MARATSPTRRPKTAITSRPSAKPAGAGAPMKTAAKPAAAKASGRRTKVEPRSLYAPAEIEALFRRFHDADPEPKGELYAVNTFTLLVAVVLSAQATDAGVNKATPELFRLADSPARMVALGEDRIRDLIKTIGLFKTKAKNVFLLSKALVETHGGEVPGEREALQALPGVGRKTANVVLNIAFGQPTIAVDTHIFRLANRLGLAPGKTPEEVERRLEAIIPEPYKRDSHHWLILHGRYVCKARKPECERCLIADLCKSPEKTASAPEKPVAF